ncbi:ATP-binding cassette domain-containing protein [Gordonia westfalica]|uniref:ATP-binding cassette domain-containing protein n=1 Tax=Gordonia westfalica TaxID=158898 RepID=A0ABU2GQY0_9ACTN|nr:ATP-binding cassette domain-containing protein [Gordonia westfalica]MDS1113873.1 ATP-binding cassette domain-containing protein [Gordonia westfalica]
MPVASGQQSSDAMRQPRHRRPEDEPAADESVAAEASENGSDDIAAKLQEWRMENARLGLATSESSAEDSADSPATEPSPSRGDEQPTHHRNERSDVHAVPNRGDSPPVASVAGHDDRAAGNGVPMRAEDPRSEDAAPGEVRPRDVRERDGAASPNPPAIEVTNLQKRFKDTVAVQDVSFTVPAGSIVALLGPNGAGKTTTVNMLCTLLKPDGGTATVNGHDVVGDSAAVRRSIMLTGQFAALDEALTGRENLILFGRLLGLSKSAAKIRADELLETFSLVEAGGKRVGQYSGGMRRRIDIACGLVTSPKVVFLDEPTTGLDPRSRLEVWSLVGQLRDEGVTILLTTQYLEEADVLSDNIVVIDKGRVIAQGTSDELKEATGAAYCEVTPTHADDLPRLQELLGDLIPDGASPHENVVAVPAPRGTETLVEVIRRTTEASIELSDVAMRRPSLDEVFLALTDPDRGGR